MKDGFNRDINYLRMSITDRCNLRCFYCTPVQGLLKLAHHEILRYEELLRLARVGADLGLSKLRVTGGEPLVRRGVAGFIHGLSKIPGVREICLTTNGVRLVELAEALWDAGLRRLNISLDSLQPQRYRQLTGGDYFYQVWEGLRLAQTLGFAPLKLNCVVMRGLNDGELLDFARLSLEYPYQIRFIEYMPIGIQSHWHRHYYLSTEAIKACLRPLGQLEEIPAESGAGPAQRYRLPGAPGEIGFISPISQHFCPTCNRLRLTAAGRLRPCLLSDQEIDIKTPLRQGAADDTLKELFCTAIQRKPQRHPLIGLKSFNCQRPMASIGG
ncbi:MAG: GTP 3',8-cyclase MoaA [Deltaproteobacteria bacterium]|nr:GTP 3',8-cyclase MoaA [Deltaproteobacteria bacterium]MBW1952934.1 GTP 3',8-cyclase MoaA [Deltaproteobacteria bacterium]MBW1986442.1 GTP 3',8-cyclase MoaA [Deltaproteobacteria bacterium]MBW2133836.1 GTP 3',8-cyclase MoaA [Deltaproteobacteria bacterium]